MSIFVFLMAAVATVAVAAFDDLGPNYTHGALVFNTLWFALYHWVQTRRLKADAEIDPLTGALNRRAGWRRIAHEFSRACRFNRQLTVLAMDIDHFKHINDAHGHATGDEVLKAVVAAMRKHCRNVDSIIRAGGEEFLMILPETAQAAAVTCAERLRVALAQAGVEGIRITASFGVASLVAGSTMDDLLSLADQACYLAKRSGRDQVRSCTELHPDQPAVGAAGVSATPAGR